MNYSILIIHILNPLFDYSSTIYIPHYHSCTPHLHSCIPHPHSCTAHPHSCTPHPHSCTPHLHSCTPHLHSCTAHLHSCTAHPPRRNTDAPSCKPGSNPLLRSGSDTKTKSINDFAFKKNPYKKTPIITENIGTICGCKCTKKQTHLKTLSIFCGCLFFIRYSSL